MFRLYSVGMLIIALETLAWCAVERHRGPVGTYQITCASEDFTPGAHVTVMRCVIIDTRDGSIFQRF